MMKNTTGFMSIPSILINCGTIIILEIVLQSSCTVKVILFLLNHNFMVKDLNLNTDSNVLCYFYDTRMS